jgi:surface antigen
MARQVAVRRTLGKPHRTPAPSPVNHLATLCGKTKLTLRGEARVMRVTVMFAAIALGWSAVPALADEVEGLDDSAELQPYLQCVPYAREVSGIQIYGDAWTWWDQAEGRYARGHKPRVGAVMAFQPYGSMTLGHVATVSRVIDSRTVLLRHANWSPIDGRRGQIEDGVRAVDVSPNNDWSQVRVWYAPIQDLGTTAWPVWGFIYPVKETRPAFELAKAETPRPIAPSRAFLNAFASFDAPASTPLVAKEKRGRGKPIDLIAQIASR